MSSREQATRDRIRRFEADVLVHLDDLYRAALRLSGNAAEAEDLTQDTCLRVFECLDQLRSPAAARVWVFTILRTTFLRRIERQTRSADVEIIDSPLRGRVGWRRGCARRVRAPLYQGRAISARRRGTSCSTRRQIARGSRLAPPSPTQVWSFVTRLWAWPT